MSFYKSMRLRKFKSLTIPSVGEDMKQEAVGMSENWLMITVLIYIPNNSI